MEYDNIIYSLLFLLVAIDAIMIPIGYITREDGVTPVFPIYGEGNFHQSDISNIQTDMYTLTSSASSFISGQLQNIFPMIQSAVGLFVHFLGFIFNLATGYWSLFTYLFAPFGKVGTIFATMLSTILSIPLIIGFLMIIRWMVQIISFVRFP